MLRRDWLKLVGGVIMHLPGKKDNLWKLAAYIGLKKKLPYCHAVLHVAIIIASNLHATT